MKKAVVLFITLLMSVTFVGCEIPREIISHSIRRDNRSVNTISSQGASLETVSSEVESEQTIVEESNAEPVSETESVQSIIGESSVASVSSETPVHDDFDADRIAAELETTVYTYGKDNKNFVFVVDNTSNYDLVIYIGVVTYDSSGNVLSSKSGTQYVAEKKNKCVIRIGVDENYSSFDYKVAVNKSSFTCYGSQIGVTTQKAINKEIITGTNNSGKELVFSKAHVLFFSNDQLVEYDYCFFTDLDSSYFQPGASDINEISCSKEYDRMEIYIEARGEMWAF